MLERLKLAIALAEAANFHRAAARLGISQPHLTRRIKSLERDLGLTLFERSRQGVLVTPQGAKVLQDAQALLKTEEVFKGKIAVLRRRTSVTLRIAVGAFISQSWVAAAITAMKATEPGISIILRELDWWKLSDAVHSGEFELALGELSEAIKYPELNYDAFPERDGVFIVNTRHALAARRSVTLEDIARFPLAGPRLPGRVARFLPASCALGSLSNDGQFFDPVIECATPRSMVDVVSASNAICMIWPEFCADQLKSGALRALPFNPPWLRTQQGIIYRRNAPLTPSALSFRSVAINAERQYFRHRKLR